MVIHLSQQFLQSYSTPTALQTGHLNNNPRNFERLFLDIIRSLSFLQYSVVIYIFTTQDLAVHRNRQYSCQGQVPTDDGQ